MKISADSRFTLVKKLRIYSCQAVLYLLHLPFLLVAKFKCFFFSFHWFIFCLLCAFVALGVKNVLGNKNQDKTQVNINETILKHWVFLVKTNMCGY